MYGYGLGYYYRAKHFNGRDYPRCPDCDGSGAQLAESGLVLECSTCHGNGRLLDPAITLGQKAVMIAVAVFYACVLVAIYMNGAHG